VAIRNGTDHAIKGPSKEREHAKVESWGSQQHKHNLANHRSLKRALLQAETQKNSEKQLFTHSDSKKNSKGIPKARRSADMGKRISDMHESTCRFNVASRKNPKEHQHHTTPTNPNPAERFETPPITRLKAHPKNTSKQTSSFGA
jgi:hypothetical protein